MSSAPSNRRRSKAEPPASPSGPASLSGTDAWPEALAEHHDWLRAVVFARVGEPAAVADVMQQVAVEAARGVDNLRDAAKLGPWLYRVAVTAALQHRRQTGRRRRLHERFAAERQPTEHDHRQPDPLDWLLAEEQRELVRRALAELPPRDAEALLLKHTQDWSYQQIADRLGVSRTAIEGRLHRARKKLRRLLADQTEADPHERIPFRRIDDRRHRA